MKINVSNKARKFLQDKKIKDITFNLKQLDVSGCCVGIVKEIEPVYEAPRNAAGYKYVRVEDYHVFISRHIKTTGSLTITTEGLWNLKRLYLSGATVPI